MAALTVQRVSKAGIDDLATALAAADVAGDEVPSASGLLVVVQNADASAHTLTVAAPVASVECGGYGALDVDAMTLVVAAGDIGFLAIPREYADANNDLAWTYDDVTSVTVGVFSIAP